ncbi:TNFAIP6 [Branchiostoma lanceolatum]|uniref:TNFAIP6 protein n=1 Tax=Branchiostoma lanceolatum TaxID=7740 RepID=A0A8J9Z8L8_BRALA|nr:TNFAIP6 [Branchiostoma lanceolatum]
MPEALAVMGVDLDYFTSDLCTPNTTCPSSGVLTDQYGSVSSMNYPFSYENKAYCEWVIAVGAGYVIQLQFTAFILEPSTSDPSCTKDYVNVYEGTGTSKTLAATYCGQSVPATFTSTGNTMSVSFTSDGSGTYQGFMAVYTAVQLTTQGTTTVTAATPWISHTESIIAVVFLCLLALLVIAMAAYCVYATCRKKPKVADGESNPLKANNQKIKNGKNGKGIELSPYDGTKTPKQAFGPNSAAAAGVVAGAAAGGTAAVAAASNNAAGKKSILKNGGGSGQKAPVTASSKFGTPTVASGVVGVASGGVGAAAGAGAGVAAGLGAGAAASSFNPTLPGAVPNNTKAPSASRALAPGPNDGYAIDPVTGREYVYDKKTGKRFWSPSPAEIAGGVWSTPLAVIKAANKFKKNGNLNF